MEFAIKKKTEYKPHEYGHRIRVKRFAWLPVVIGDKRVWLEFYISVLEWTKSAGVRIYNGYFVQSYADDWVTVAKVRIPKKIKEKKYWSTYPGKVNQVKKDMLKKSFPYGDTWTFRVVKQVRMKNAFYKVGQVLKVKYFATFGCYDHKDRWVDYWDLGEEVPQPKNWKD